MADYKTIRDKIASVLNKNIKTDDEEILEFKPDNAEETDGIMEFDAKEDGEILEFEAAD